MVVSIRGRSKLRGELIPIAIIMAMVVLFTLLNLSYSFKFGVLSNLMGYDDVVYLLDAYNRIYFGGGRSLYGAASSIVADPPHSPISTVIAMIGFTVFGPFMWAPYAANSIGLTLYAFSVYSISRSYLTQTKSLAICLAAMLVPAAGAIVTEFRPDMIGGTIFGATIYLLLKHDFHSATLRNHALIGLVAALSLMIKPSSLPVVLPVVGLSALLSVALTGREWKAAFLGALKVGFVTFLVLLPYAYLWGGATLDYIYSVLVTNSDVWVTPGSRSFHAFYHSFGVGGERALNIFLLIGLVFIAVDIVANLTRKDGRRRLERFSYYGIVTVIYLGLSLTAEKTVYQGSFFYFPFLFATVMAFARIWSQIPAQAAYLPILAVGLLIAVRPTGHAYRDFLGNNDVYIGNEMTENVAGYLRSRTCPESGPPVLVVMDPQPVNPETIALKIALDHQTQIFPMPMYLTRTIDLVEPEIERASIVVTSLRPQREGTYALPGVELTPAVHQLLLENSSFTPIVLQTAPQVTMFFRDDCPIN